MSTKDELYSYDLKILPTKAIQFASKIRVAALTIILIIQLYAGIKLYSLDLIMPFSNIKNVARFIENSQPKNSIIVGVEDLNIAPVSAWLNRQIYYPEVKGYGSFTVWTPDSTSRNSNITVSEIIAQIKQLKQNCDRHIILVTDRPLAENTSNSILNLVSSFTTPSLLLDKYFIYLI